MATPQIGSAGVGGDSFLPATGFGPGSIIIAIIGGVLTLSGLIARRLGRRAVTPAA